MSVVQKQVNVVSSVDELLAIVVGLATDVKAGKPLVTVVSDAVPGLIQALTAVGDLKQDVLDRKDLESTVALKLAELVNVLAS